MSRKIDQLLFLVDWTDGPSTHQSDQLEEGLHEACMSREGKVDFLRSKAR